MGKKKHNSEKIICEFSVKRLEILDKDGNVDKKLMPNLSAKDIQEMYKHMIRTRTLDAKTLKLQRQGRMGTMAPTLGQEACQVGTAYALNEGDWFVQSFRELGALLTLGFPMKQFLLYFGGDERGSKCPDNLNILPTAIPISTQVPHAAGIAWANKLKKNKKVTMVFHGDGGTSEGDFHEGMNFAGEFKLPCIIVCQNNQWAISLPRSKQTASKTIAQKAIAYGFEGIQVDGNDIFAVYKASKDAIEKARKGEGPTFLELETFRMGDHTTADDASRYRDKKLVEKWKTLDPIIRLEKYMRNIGIWDDAWAKKVQDDATAEVEKAVEEYENDKNFKVEDIFDYMYEKTTPELEEQKKYLLDFLKEG